MSPIPATVLLNANTLGGVHPAMRSRRVTEDRCEDQGMDDSDGHQNADRAPPIQPHDAEQHGSEHE